MNWQALEHKLSPWVSVVYLEHQISHPIRRVLKKIFLVLTVLNLGVASEVFFPVDFQEAWLGSMFVFLFLFITLALAEAFFYSNFFKDVSGESFGPEVAFIVSSTKRQDITSGFISSLYGKMTLARLGIDRKSLKDFLKQRKTIVSADSITFPESKNFLELYLSSLLSKDSELEIFLMSHGVTKEMLILCAHWLMTGLRRQIDLERWWSETNLSKIDGIGRDWAYGKTYFLSRYSRYLRIRVAPGSTYHAAEALTLETTLSKGRESNAIIVGEEGVGKIEIIELLAQKIQYGQSTPALKDKKFVVFETAAFIAAMPDKDNFEKSIIKIFNEASSAGNVILIIPDFSNLLHNASVLGSDLPSLIDPFLASEELQVIAITNNQDFHSHIEANQVLMQRFDTVLVKGGSESQVLSVLEEDIMQLERREKTFFTYQAIFEAVNGADRYFVGKPLLDTALDLLSQAAASARNANRTEVSKEDVLSLIRSKTGVPTGEVSSAEQDKLTHLEGLLHQRVIGQDEAISSVSDALRRARTGITNPNRPIGSFLFLGPTGVGKTETTKALAEIFFGREGKILRLDMSEYNTPDAINRLIGSIGDESGGILGSMIRENQYGVLLLDEFEKTDKKVMNLFLQILDEGIFSDTFGRKVSARNLIIVATSNAGGEMIFDIVRRGEKLVEKKDSIIEEVIRQGIYKPELINRFDGVIIFHPLEESHLREVAKLMLEKLALRLKDQGITLAINDSLIGFLVARGNDPKFGARSLNRALQDTVEKVIADKIIGGSVHPGSELILTEEDLK